MLADLKRVNPRQYELVVDPAPHVAGLCPRRAGKSYAGAAAALITGEAKPGSISIIISLNLKQLRRLYWAGGPSGLHALNRKYGLNIEFNTTYLRWEHENGSIGYLLGAEDDEQLEVIRGLEGDLYLIDECKSFPPAKLEKLVDEIIDPQRETRDGRLILIGTPGFLQAGPFWQATCPEAKDNQGRKFHVLYTQKDPHGRTPNADLLWSLHTWTLKENRGVPIDPETDLPKQWMGALRKKKAKGWADDDPVWCREYLGMWTASSEGLVYAYASQQHTGDVSWIPNPDKDNPAGLPEEGAPWRFIGGLDMGFEAPTAFVVLAYSSKLRELRHVVDFSRAHMLVPDIAEMIRGAMEVFGQIEVIHADCGNLGKMVMKTLVEEYGLPLVRAEKKDKFDHIELVNSAFIKGEIKIIQGTTLEYQLLTNCWRLSDDARDGESERDRLARIGKLREDDSVPNDSTDAFLYAYRGALYHFGARAEELPPPVMSPEWIKLWEKQQLKNFRARLAAEAKQKAAGISRSLTQIAPSFLRGALNPRGAKWIPSISTQTNYRRFYPS